MNDSSHVPSAPAPRVPGASRQDTAHEQRRGARSGSPGPPSHGGRAVREAWSLRGPTPVGPAQSPRAEHGAPARGGRMPSSGRCQPRPSTLHPPNPDGGLRPTNASGVLWGPCHLCVRVCVPTLRQDAEGTPNPKPQSPDCSQETAKATQRPLCHRLWRQSCLTDTRGAARRGAAVRGRGRQRQPRESQHRGPRAPAAFTHVKRHHDKLLSRTLCSPPSPASD